MLNSTNRENKNREIPGFLRSYFIIFLACNIQYIVTQLERQITRGCFLTKQILNTLFQFTSINYNQRV